MWENCVWWLGVTLLCDWLLSWLQIPKRFRYLRGSVGFLSASERTSEFAGVGDPVIIGLTLIGVLDPKGDRLLTTDVGHFGETVQLKIDTRSESNFQEGRSLVPTSKGRCSFSRFGLRLQVDWLRLLWPNKAKERLL